MAAPAYVTAGSGVVSQTTAVNVALSPSTIGSVYILQVLQDGTTAGEPTTFLAGNSNLENLAGTDDAMTKIGAFDVGSAATAKQHLYIGRGIGTSGALATVTANSVGGNDCYARLYEFSGVHTGTTLSDVIENSTAGSTTNTAGTSATIADAGVTTLGADRLALNFVGGNDDNALDAFTGETGGDWTEAVAEYATATGTDAAIGLQIATIASAGTIDGGTDGWADAADSWGVVGFALIPATAAVPASLLLPNRSNRVVLRTR